MKQQVARLSPHQNGKVFGVMTAITSLIVFVPIVLIMSMVVPAGKAPPLFLLLLAPVFYLILSYLFTAIGCLIYNLIVPYVGGIEYETRPRDGE